MTELKRKSTQLRKSIGGKSSSVFQQLDEKISEMNPADKNRVSNLAAFVTDLGKSAGIEAPAIDQSQESAKILEDVLNRMTRASGALGSQIVASKTLQNESKVRVIS